MIAVSTICYLHGKILGLEQASKVLQAQVLGQEVRGAPVPRAVDAIRKLGEHFGALEELNIRLDPNGSSLGKARARALHWAHASGASAWVSIDDDVTASPGTLQTLVRLCREVDTPRIIVAPCALRSEESREAAHVNVIPVTDSRPSGLLYPLWRGGFGLVAMNRAALVAIVAGRPKWRDDDGQILPLVFNCEIVPGFLSSWLGEDFSFFDQVRELAECYFLTRGETDHAGAIIDLSDVPALFP